MEMNENDFKFDAIMSSCKFLLPCGRCEMTKKICTADNPMTITPTWTATTPTEVTCSAERREE